jgi:hypothetical protein
LVLVLQIVVHTELVVALPGTALVEAQVPLLLLLLVQVAAVVLQQTAALLVLVFVPAVLVLVVQPHYYIFGQMVDEQELVAV